MVLDHNWFSESFTAEGVAFSLRIGERLHSEKTAYQHIEVYETTDWGRLMTIDGCVMLTGRDNFLYHEMMTHPALFTHRDPRHVLIIGGGDCGTLREVLRHEVVERVVQVDIDEGVTRAAEQFFPELTESNGDARAEIRFEDGVRYLREANAHGFDLIIIDSTDPVGIAEGLFGPAFLRDVHRVLRVGGVLAQQSESPLLHGDSIIRGLHSSLESAGFAERATLPFPVPSYPGGWWSCTLAGKSLDVTRFRERDAAEKTFETRYYNDGIHRGALCPPEFARDLFIARRRRG